MHCELVVPGLFSGDAGGRLPSLELVLARGRCTAGGSQPLERWLADAFGLEGVLPAGAVSLLAGGGEPGASLWSRADPVHLRLMRDRLVLVPAAALRITAPEAETLCRALNAYFAGRMELRVIDPQRWVARLAEPLAVGDDAPLTLSGRHVELAAGGDTPSHQLLNESQMVLHGHAVNEARETHGEPTANSLWFWGPGTAPLDAKSRFESVSAAEPVAIGLARAARSGARAMPASAGAWLDAASAEGRHLVVLDALRVPLALAETGQYEEALAALERDWFSPLLEALRRGRIGMLTVHVPDGPECVTFEAVRGDLRRFWKRPKSLAAYA